MNFYKNIEIAKKYNVSIDTVANWIRGSLENRNQLELYFNNIRNYIVINATNELLLEDLAKKSKKFKNKKSLRKIYPSNVFYDLFSEKQIIEIATSIEESLEIPYKYCHLGKGAQIWDEYVNRVLVEKDTASIKRTLKGFHQNLEYINSLIESYDKVNIIDIGVGNGKHIQPLLDFLIQKNLLRKYIGLDISYEMIEIAFSNYKKWYGNNILLEYKLIDINNDQFLDITQTNSNPADASEKIVNIVVYVGSCIENQKTYEQSLQTIHESLGKNDIFILGHILDNEKMRAHLYFSEKEKLHNSDLEFEVYMLDLLNMTPDTYDLSRYFDDSEKARIINAKLNVDIILSIKTKNFQKDIKLYSKDNLIVFRHNHHTSSEAYEILSKLKFNIMSISISEDGNQIMIISKKI